jgi:hypothetical protein
MRLEIPFPEYENPKIPTLEDKNTEIFENKLTAEDAGRIAGRLAMIGIAYNTAVVMPGAELATLEAVIASMDAVEAAKYRENAQNN